MKEKLITLLCCPACKGDLVLRQAVEGQDREISKGILKCSQCQKEYPILNYIPRFVETDKYVGNFSFEWLLYKKTQLDSATGTRESRNTFIEKTGVSPEQLQHKTVLDVGCGTGRYMEIAGKNAAEVVGVDLSFAVETALENVGHKSNMHIVQADIFNLPFKERVFDLVYSIGVLHHTPSTEKAFSRIVPLAKDNGIVSIWVYSNETNYEKWRNRFTDLYRLITIHLQPKVLWYLCHLAIPLYYVKKVKKLATIFDMVLPMSNHPDTHWRVLDTYDWYSPRYQFKHTYQEVEKWFSKAGFKTINRLSFPVAVKGENKR